MRDLFADISLLQLRAIIFLVALMLYAFLGSPTPDHPGMAELVIAVMLILAVGLPDAAQAVRVDSSLPLWQAGGRLLLIYGLAAGLMMGFVQGQSVTPILRDLAPFLFMLLPVFLAGLCRDYLQVFKYILGGVLIVGVVFSLRALEDVGYQVISVLLPSSPEHELTYMANAPTVLFTALILMGYGGYRLIKDFTARSFVAFIAMAALAAVVFLPIALTTQRASLGYAGLYGFLLLGLAIYYAPYRGFVLAVIILSILSPFSHILNELTSSLTQKTSLVGFNMRFEELAAVWAEISGSIWTMLFGMGWGGMFYSPAVGGVYVNFTHSLLSSMLLKLGLAGLILTILYLFGLAQLLYRMLRPVPYLALALAGPVAIDVFLYASFKSLDFGLILLLISAYTLCHENLQSGAGYSKEEAKPKIEDT